MMQKIYLSSLLVIVFLCNASLYRFSMQLWTRFITEYHNTDQPLTSSEKYRRHFTGYLMSMIQWVATSQTHFRFCAICPIITFFDNVNKILILYILRWCRLGSWDSVTWLVTVPNITPTSCPGLLPRWCGGSAFYRIPSAGQCGVFNSNSRPYRTALSCICLAILSWMPCAPIIVLMVTGNSLIYI